jgi:PAP2 superfamily
VLYPVMTTLAVIVTANHFWLDGIVAAVILVVVLLVQAAGRRMLRERRAQKVAAEPETASLSLTP